MEQVNQQIQEIEVSKLNLWSENPRDPIESDIGDLELVKRAVKDDNRKWNLIKFIREMGNHYDYSELPTVVKKNNKFYVYDGNRRIAVLKYLQNPSWVHQIEGKLFPSSEPALLKNLVKIYCNVCDEKTALMNIERKHVSNGSWKQLERDYFEHNFRGKEKSLFLKFEEATGLISKYPELNENIMKMNILTLNKLKEIGFSFDKYGNFVSVYDESTAKNILDKLAELKVDGIISSRGDDKYDIKKPLLTSTEFKNKIKRFKDEEAKKVNYTKDGVETQSQKTKRQNKEKQTIFGGDLFLKNSITNDIYRDIVDLNSYYQKNKSRLSTTFPNLIRMSLRLLVESAKEKDKDMDHYIKSNFINAKNNLTQDQKTTLSTYSVESDSRLIALLQTGAHTYSSSCSVEQTMAMSLIIGQILKITHNK